MQQTVQQTVITGPAGPTLVLTPRCEHFDSGCASDFLREAMVALGDRESPDRYHRVVFNMEWVQLVDSSGLGALSRCARMLPAGEQGVTLCNVSEELRVALSLSRLDRTMTVRDTCGDIVSDGPQSVGPQSDGPE